MFVFPPPRTETDNPLTSLGEEMMRPSRLLVASFLTLFGIATSHAQTFEALKGTCAIAVSTHSDQFEVRLERGTCPKEVSRDSPDYNRDARRDCHTTEMQQPLDAFSGFIQSDLGRDGAHKIGR